MTTQNRFYNESFTAAAGSLGRVRAVDAQFTLLQQAAYLIQQEIDAIQGAGGNITDLGQFPASLTGQALKLLRVNAGASAIEFIGPGNITVKSVGGTSYTLLAADAGSILLFTSGSPVTVTAPNAVMQQGDVVLLAQYGGGRVTVAAGVGATVNSSDGLLATRAQYAQMGIVATDTDEFLLVGERNAATLGFATLTGGNQFTGVQSVAFTTLTDGATINTDASLSNNFRVTLGGNRTLANPTNLKDGACYNWYIKQDGTGSRTLAYGSKFKFVGTSVLSTAASAKDLLVGIYDATDDVILCVLTKGFA